MGRGHGFLLTILTIQGLPVAVDELGWQGAVPLLALGPLAGTLAMGLLNRDDAVARRGAAAAHDGEGAT